MLLWEIFWFFLPAGIANMAPVFAVRLPGLRHWNTPLDFGKSFRGRRIFGDNKTWRGMVFGVVCAILFGLLQYRGIAYSAESTSFIIVASGMLGLGALVGDALASFFKRQRDIPAGQAWIPVDQTDYIIGGLLFVYPLIPNQLTSTVALATIALYMLLHVVFSYIGYLLGLKKQPI